jgi:hypothetical protein
MLAAITSVVVHHEDEHIIWVAALRQLLYEQAHRIGVIRHLCIRGVHS